MSHQYRDWRDYLIRCLDDYMPKTELYQLLQSSTLVGLFTRILVKSHLRDRIKNLSAIEVKRGMGGLHGNKVGLQFIFLGLKRTEFLGCSSDTIRIRRNFNVLRQLSLSCGTIADKTA